MGLFFRHAGIGERAEQAAGRAAHGRAGQRATVGGGVDAFGQAADDQ